MPERELAFEIGDLFVPIRDLLFLLGQLFAEPLILLLQSFNLVRLAIRQGARAFAASHSRLSPWLHQSERTKFMPKVQAPPELLQRQRPGADSSPRDSQAIE